MQVHPNLSVEEGREIVEKVFPECFKDFEPFRESEV